MACYKLDILPDNKALVHFPYNPMLIDAMKSIGCRWSPDGKHTHGVVKCWWTDKEDAIKMLQSGLNESDPRAVHALFTAKRKGAIEQSFKAHSDFQPPVPEGNHPATGKPFQLMPFQRAGVEFAMTREGTLIADEMGLGKTLQFIATANCIPNFKRGLIICPASLKVNWFRELKTWLTHKNLFVGIAQGSYWPETDIVIINYDIVHRHREAIDAIEWDLVGCDEAHYLKGASTNRTKAVIGGTIATGGEMEDLPNGKRKRVGAVEHKFGPIKAKRRICLTGTPILNRPAELFSLLNWLDPKEWPDRFRFARRYCAGGYGMYDGASNLEELQLRLRSSCFRYETMVQCDVGILPIGRIVEEKLNVRVKSYNEKTAAVEWRKVVAHSKRAAPNKLVRILHSLGELYCTPDHKIWTTDGYKRADSLSVGVCLRVLQDNQNCNGPRGTNECSILFSKVRRAEEGVSRSISAQSQSNKDFQAQSSRRQGLSTVRRAYEEAEPSGLRMEGNKLLQSALSVGKTLADSCSCEKNSGRIENTPIRGSEAALGDRIEKTVWKRNDIHTENNSLGYPSTLGIGLSRRMVRGGVAVSAAKWAVSSGSEELLVDGYSLSDEQGVHRSGRQAPQALQEAEGERFLEDENTKDSWVESVEILERGCGQEYQECLGGYPFVYDIEVEHNHNFFPAGVLAHNCMIRRLKKDVLTELPPKLRSVIEYEDPALRLELEEEVKKAKASEHALASLRAAVEFAKASADPNEYKRAVEALRSGISVAFQEMAILRHHTAVAKIPHVIQHLKDLLAQSDEKILVFAHHRDVIDAIVDEFPFNAVKLYGGMAQDTKQESVDKLQKDPNTRIFVGGIQAAGVGLTLTASHRVIFAELDWVPSNVTQCEDRCVLEGQPILTPSGWKPIQSIAVGDLVIGSDGKAHKVLDAWNRGCTKPITEIRVEGWNGWVKTTHDHPYLINGEWREAATLFVGDRITPPRTAYSGALYARRLNIDTTLYAENGRKKPAPTEIVLTPEALFTLGYFVGDGFASTKENKGRFVSFSGHQKKDEGAFATISDWFSQYGLVGRNRKQANGLGMEMRFYSAEWAQWFSREFGKYAHGKELPEWVWHLSPQQQRWLLDGLAASDGYNRDGKGRIEYVTASNKLASQVYRLAINCGYAVGKHLGSEKSGGHNVISWCKEGTSGTVLEVRHRYPKKIDGKRERVYDLTVEGCSSFVVGPAVVHNCHRIGQQEPVLIQHIVLAGSLDATIARKLIAKQAIIDRALDDKEKMEHDAIIPTEEQDYEQTPIEAIDREGTALTAAEVRLIEEEVRRLVVHASGLSAVDSILASRLAQLESMTNRQAALALTLIKRNNKEFKLPC